MSKNVYCPNCGHKLEQGEYAYNCDTANNHVEHCPECGEEGGVVLNDVQAVKKYCEENIEDFSLRYEMALRMENRMRCPLEHADPNLYGEIRDKIEEWCDDNEENVEVYDIDNLF